MLFMPTTHRKFRNQMLYVISVTSKTVVRTGCCNEEGMEKAEVHGLSRRKEKER